MNDVPPIIGAANDADVDSVRALLTECGLPINGFELAFPSGFALVRTTDIVACAGIEVYGELGLLRSVAVNAANRGKGLGHALIANRIEFARKVGLSALYALTTTAPAFFVQHGFQSIARDQAPDGIRHSSEFSTVCPSSAVLLRYSLP